MSQSPLKVPCACGSGQLFEACCYPFISGDRLPQHPEQLMRSRYTAYSQANTDYIKQTMCGVPLKNFDQENAYLWASTVGWMELKVLHAVEEGDEGSVEFIAYFTSHDQLQELHECSHFIRQNGRWFYDGELKPKKIGRNDPCSCGSGKKYKKCCGGRG